jgi:hypothetical protein
MEFRSYYAGKTVIRATSPGLETAKITLHTLGEPKFAAGKTPAVKPRPYVRFTGPPARFLDAPRSSIFGVNNPCLASSETPGHAASSANDGNDSTFWRAANADSKPWWQVDLERAVTAARVKITFPTAANYRYQIETSSDGSHWVLVDDQSQTASSEKVRMEVLTPSVSAHLLRVTFTGEAAISEVEIQGQLTAQ